MSENKDYFNFFSGKGDIIFLLRNVILFDKKRDICIYATEKKSIDGGWTVQGRRLEYLTLFTFDNS